MIMMWMRFEEASVTEAAIEAGAVATAIELVVIRGHHGRVVVVVGWCN